MKCLPYLYLHFLLPLLLISISVNAQQNGEKQIEVTGIVTQENKPLVDVNVIIIGKSVGTKTDQYGNYSLKVFEGDILQFTYLGNSTVNVKIKRNEKIINIEMISESYMLEETVLKSVKSKSKNLEERDKSFKTSKGNINPRTAGYKTSYINDDFSSYESLTKALLSRMPSYKVKKSPEGFSIGFIRNLPVIWDIDGFVSDVEPTIILSNIKDIRVLGTAEAVKYGLRCKGLGGVGNMRSCGAVIKITMKKNFKKERTLEEKNKISKILDSIKNINFKGNKN